MERRTVPGLIPCSANSCVIFFSANHYSHRINGYTSPLREDFHLIMFLGRFVITVKQSC